MKKIIVIGGGAAGMAAAIAAAENGCAATIYEKNEKLGKKIYITGKGRCNVTNDCDMEGLFDSVVTNSRFLYSAFYGFSNQDMKDFLEANGCHVKVERGNRVFPVSDRASDVTSAFARRLRELRVKVELNQGVRELWLEDGVLKGVILAQGGNERGKKGSYIAADAVRPMVRVCPNWMCGTSRMSSGMPRCSARSSRCHPAAASCWSRRTIRSRC